MNCPHCGKAISPDLAAKALRSIKSERRAKASAENGKKGGRPRKDPEPEPDVDPWGEMQAWQSGEWEE